MDDDVATDLTTKKKKKNRCSRTKKIKVKEDKKNKKPKKDKKSKKEKKEKKKKGKKGGAGESDSMSTEGSSAGKSLSRASSRTKNDTTSLSSLKSSKQTDAEAAADPKPPPERKKSVLSIIGLGSRSASRTDDARSETASSAGGGGGGKEKKLKTKSSKVSIATRTQKQSSKTSVKQPNLTAQPSKTSLASKKSKMSTTTDAENTESEAADGGGTDTKEKRSFFRLRKKTSKAGSAVSTASESKKSKKKKKPKRKRSVLGRMWGGKSAEGGGGEPEEETGTTTGADTDDDYRNVAADDLAAAFQPPEDEDLTQEQTRQQCLRLLAELENLYNSSAIESQVDHYKRLNEFLDGEIKNAVKTAEQIQVAVEKYENEKLQMADRLGELYKEAIRQRRLAKAIDIKERYAKLMEDSEEGKRVSAMHLDQVDWNEELRNDFKFWIKQWERDEIRFAKEEELLAEDYKHQSAEYYEMKAVTDKATRQMREVQEEFRSVVDGYRGQLSELKEKMLEVIKRERARHHFLQERLERRESERATRYEVLQEIRDKAVKATYNVHTRFANYIMHVKTRWKVAEADLEKLATSKKGKVTLSPEAQELIAELKIFNPRRLERIKNDLNAQVEQLRNRLRETLKQKRPLVAKRAEMLRRMREEKDSKEGSEARSDDSGFAVHPMKLTVSGTSNYEKQFEREQFYLDTDEDRKLFEKEADKPAEEDFYTENRRKAEAAKRDSQSELERLLTGASTSDRK